MKTVLFVVGPALGHVGRCLAVARSLSHPGIKVEFAGVDQGYGARLIGGSYRFHRLRCIKGGDVVFAAWLENTIRSVSPHLICLDLSPLPWLPLVRFPTVPCIYLTNSFLALPNEDRTEQDILFDENRRKWNFLRSCRRLPRLTGSRDLYRRDLILLADPPILVPALPCEIYRNVGPCIWEPETQYPTCLDEAGPILYVSLGSTGLRALPAGFVSKLAIEVEAQSVVWSGRGDQASFIDNGIRHFSFSWLPAGKVLNNAVFALTQGGAGSSYQALAHGVPIGLWPSHRNHKILAKSLATHGVGVNFGDDWRHELKHLKGGLEQKRETARLVADNLKRIDGPCAVARTIIDILK